MTYLKKNKKLLVKGSEALTVDDVLLVPTYGTVNSRAEVSIFNPLIAAPMDSVFNLERFIEYSNAELDTIDPTLPRTATDLYALKAAWKPSWYGWIAVSTDPDEIDSVISFFNSLADHIWIQMGIMVDTAHGLSPKAVRAYEQIRRALPWINLMSGSVATGEAAVACAAYCTHIRVGIGSGSMCTTRIQTGVGVPNLTAVADCYYQLSKDNVGVNIVADGGISAPGDVVKYLAAGADQVMVGRLFAECLDSAAPTVAMGSKIYKTYRGQASKEYQEEHIGEVRNGLPEGVTRTIQAYPKSMKERSEEICAGIKSACSYLGFNNSRDLNPANVRFIRCSSSTLKESKPLEV